MTSERDSLAGDSRLDAQGHIDLLNRELRYHEYFKEGMEFLPYPVAVADRALTGYSVTGPYELRGVYAAVAGIVASRFSLPVSFLI